MRYQIVTRKPSFLRIRFGKYIFTREQGYGIASDLLHIDGVESVVTNEVNGSVTVHYSGDLEQLLLDKFTKLRQCDLHETNPTDTQRQKDMDNDFQERLLLMVAKKLTVDLIFPKYLRNALTWKRSFRFMHMGARALSRGKMSVEVLDGTAITASLFTGQHSTASSIMFLLNLSDLMLEYSNARAKNALASSLAIQISKVWLVTDDVEVSLPIGELKIDDIIRVRAGSMVPVDGTIVSGEALINEATMTGEPLAVHKNAGSTVFAGTVVETGEIDIQVKALSSDSRISKIIQMIDDGEDTKAHIQGKAERLADGIVPVSFGLFLATFLFTGNISRALSVLMVDFSCAIKLTTPISIISALREGANKEIVVKGGKYLEILSKVDTIVFDKTGTLTNAVPKVSKILPMCDKYDENQVLMIAACLEEHFPHSVAAAIVAHAENQGLYHPEEHEKVEYIVAHGIASSYQGKRAIIGSRHFVFEDENIPYPTDKQQFLEDEIGSDSAVYLAMEGKLIGIICVNDPPRDEAKAVISALRKQGIREIIMITGDGESTARHISENLGLDRYFASVLPDQKAHLVDELKAEGKTVLMVGDGINDAPALSTANVSMTLNGSSDIAREVSDIALLSDTLETMITARELACSLMNKISTNYRFIVGFNSALIACGIFGFIPASTSAWLHNASTVTLAGVSTRSLLNSPKNDKKEATLDEES
ncbi:MAG: heavy metal translocating P-type ATPase [Clostridia bacterium]